MMKLKIKRRELQTNKCECYKCIKNLVRQFTVYFARTIRHLCIPCIMHNQSLHIDTGFNRVYQCGSTIISRFPRIRESVFSPVTLLKIMLIKIVISCTQIRDI
jgi:hypothetical protein